MSVDTAAEANADAEPASAPGASLALLVLVIGYVGIYLCRKNLSVAVPLLQTSFGATKTQVGLVASVGSVTYFVGKLINGPIVDRLGGRAGALISLVAVALFGAAGAFSPGLAVLAVAYGFNRYAGSAGWGAMLKLVPTWFGPARAGTAVAVLSLGYVAGGVAATALASEIVAFHGGWRAVMGVPSIFLAAIVVVCFFAVREGPLGATKSEHANEGSRAAPRAPLGPVLLALFKRPQFLITCALSFTLTLMRETFNTWSVDFLTSLQGATLTKAAWQSIGFDLAGGVSILIAGAAFDLVSPARRGLLMAVSLGALGFVLAALPPVAAVSANGAAALVAAVGLLVYGPYSLLAGALALESGGKEAAATAAGIIDGVGYIGGAIAGAALGKVLDVGGYALGFRLLAGVTAASALIALALKPVAREPADRPV